MSKLEHLVAEEVAQPVDPRVAAFAAHIAGQYPGAARAVLFYGSCLRTSDLDGQMLDFYLIVSDYEAAYESGWLRRANRALPPNVFPFNHDGLQAKVAVLSDADFARLCSVRAGDVSVWARFAQPSRLVWAADGGARDAAIAAIAQAPLTLFHHAAPLTEGDDPLAVWREGFARTYACELRAERKGRAGSVVDAEPERYRLFGDALLAGGAPSTLNRAQAERCWRRFARRGKALSVARLAKATTTYAGGIDYIAWKINRHAGTELEVKEWQRRHPIIGGLSMLPKLLRSGAVK